MTQTIFHPGLIYTRTRCHRRAVSEAVSTSPRFVYPLTLVYFLLTDLVQRRPFFASHDSLPHAALELDAAGCTLPTAPSCASLFSEVIPVTLLGPPEDASESLMEVHTFDACGLPDTNTVAAD
uniref:Uncharacterized protein n=1 Tax=Steinernema glaseri TaxID=37863 RepID=A0A1I7YVH5_9BILA